MHRWWVVKRSEAFYCNMSVQFASCALCSACSVSASVTWHSHWLISPWHQTQSMIRDIWYSDRYNDQSKQRLPEIYHRVMFHHIFGFALIDDRWLLCVCIKYWLLSVLLLFKTIHQVVETKEVKLFCAVEYKGIK